MSGRLEPSIADMMPALLASVEDIALRVLTDAERRGNELYGRGPNGGKWSIVVRGGKTGVWQDFSTGTAGDLFAFIQHGACEGDAKRAWLWARQYSGDGPRPAGPKPKRPVPDMPWSPATNGHTLWLASDRFAWNNPVGLYLIGRGIDPGELGDARLGALRFSPQCWNAERRAPLPAMLAAVIDPITGNYQGTHRTWLEPDGENWHKARLAEPKKSLGKIRGGVIPLLTGGSSRSLPRCQPGAHLVLGEGIENVLSVGQYRPEDRAAAYVSAGNLLAVDLPEAIVAVCLIRDRDGENRGVESAREQAIAWWRQEGRAVELWEPPPGCKDANDWLTQERFT